MKMTPTQKWILGGLALAGLAAAMGAYSSDSDGGDENALLYPPVSPLRVRMDPLGDGHFGSSREGHTHQGVDLETTAGAIVRSPVAGVVTRTFYVYQDSQKWTGIEVKTPSGHRVKVMYVVPGIALQSNVQIGDALGTAQPIHERYGAAMHDHIHVEVWTPAGKPINPEPLFGAALAGCPCQKIA